MQSELLVQLIRASMFHWTSEETVDLLNKLPTDSEEAAGYYCDKLELGGWFYESMILNDVDIREELERLVTEKILNEYEDREENRELLRVW